MIRRRAFAGLGAAALLLGLAAWFLLRPAPVGPGVAVVRPAGPVAPVPAPTAPALPAPQVAPEVAGDGPSHLADALNAPAGTIRADLEILNDLIVAWQSNFPREGNPVGENAEITAALTGANRLAFAFLPPRHPAINARGELCDRWGTPFRFHQVSGTQMEFRSAGPDRKFATADDVFWPPETKP